MDILLGTIVDTDPHSPAVSGHLGPVQLLHLLHLLQPCQGELRAPLRLRHVPAARPEISGDVSVHQPDGLVPLPHRGLGRLLRVHHRPGRGGRRVQRLAAAAHLPASTLHCPWHKSTTVLTLIPIWWRQARGRSPSQQTGRTSLDPPLLQTTSPERTSARVGEAKPATI